MRYSTIIKVVFLGAVTLTAFSMGCAHYPNVRPGSGGIHHVVVRAADKETAETEAIRQADCYCDDKKLGHPAFINEENTKYEGTMDEGTRNTIKGVSTGAMVGGAVLGNSVGKGLFGAGAAGSAMTSGKDYKADMKFKCEK